MAFLEPPCTSLHENRATEATWLRRDGGKCPVRIEVPSARFHANAGGAQKPMDLDDPVDEGSWARRGQAASPEERILLGNRRVDRPEKVLEIVVNQKPKKAGIDPFSNPVDWTPENVLTAALRTTAAR